MSAYKVKILKPNNWRKHPVGRLDISVGMPNHESHKLAATIAWAKQHFSHIIISAADTLQRHNYMAEGLKAETAYDLSYQMGTEWIDRNRDILAGTTIIRWNQRLGHPLFKQYLKRTHENLEFHPAFKSSLHEEAGQYAARKGLSVTRHRINYLVEEIAVFDMLFGIEPAADIYPGSLLPFWDQELYKAKAAFTRIDFTRRKTAA